MAQRKSRKTPATKNGRRSALPPRGQAPAVAMPDAVGDHGRVQILASQLIQLQRQLFELRVVQAANGREDSDGLDSSEPLPEGETRMTYGERREVLEGATQRVWEISPELRPQIERVITDALAQATPEEVT